MPGRAIDKPFVHLDPADPKYEKIKTQWRIKRYVHCNYIW
jgi:hypothetical protein